jgi:hypothetical protein
MKIFGINYYYYIIIIIIINFEILFIICVEIFTK